MLYRLFPNKKIRHIVSSPIIYSVIIPFIILDIWVELYHRICFFLYGIPYVDRSKYIRVWDRTKLQYLRGIDKLNCAYCGYGNGLLAYAGEIAAQTETYWCGVKHAEDPTFIPSQHHKQFTEYDDEKEFKEKYSQS